MLPTKIISGGQTGADQAALRFALANGIEPGGWCPKGRRCEVGVIAEADFVRFKLREATTRGYEERTRLNVRDSDATVIFNRGPALSPGCGLTASQCRALQRPCCILRLPVAWFGMETPDAAIEAEGRALARFLAQRGPATLNVAGNREGTTPNIGRLVERLLGSAWMQFDEVAAEQAQAAAAPVAAPSGQLSLFGLPDERSRPPAAVFRGRS